MISEIGGLLRLMGPRRLIANARSMKQARAEIRGYTTSVVYWALLRTGFIGALEDPAGVVAADFCAAHACDPAMLDRLCLYLSRRGHLAMRDGRVTFTATGRRFWQQVSGVFHIFNAYEPFLSNLEGGLTGDVDLASLHRRDEMVAIGFRQTGAAFTFAGIASILRKHRFRGMVELGCGNIDCSLYVSREQPTMRFLGIDNDPRFLDEARATIERERLADRVTLLDHDLFDLTPEAFDFTPYDVVVGIDLFHGYFFQGRERVLDLFRALRRTFNGKTFVVSEMCLADEDRMAGIAYPMIEHELFHGMTQQRTFAAGELEGLLEEAGFTIRTVWSARNAAARLFLHFDA